MAKAPWVPPPSLAKPGVHKKIQKLCLSFPGVTERPSHGAPCFFAGKKQFAVISDNHHHDGRFALLVAAPSGAQAMLVDSEPEHYYVPPYVGGRGWVGVRLDRKVPWAAIAALVEAGYREVAPKIRTRSTGTSASRRPS